MVAVAFGVLVAAAVDDDADDVADDAVDDDDDDDDDASVVVGADDEEDDAEEDDDDDDVEEEVDDAAGEDVGGLVDVSVVVGCVLALFFPNLSILLALLVIDVFCFFKFSSWIITSSGLIDKYVEISSMAMKYSKMFL